MTHSRTTEINNIIEKEMDLACTYRMFHVAAEEYIVALVYRTHAGCKASLNMFLKNAKIASYYIFSYCSYTEAEIKGERKFTNYGHL